MNGKPTRILLVEDNPGDARLLREALGDVRDTQIEFSHVGRLDEALGRLREEQFNVILLDLSLPDSQGIETVVRVQGQAPAVPIVILTGLNDEEMAIKAVRAGAQDYLVKGQVDGNLLVRAMRYAIERKKVEKQLQLQLQRIYALRGITEAITSTLDLQSVLNVLMEKIKDLLPNPASLIWLFNKETGRFERACCSLNENEEEWKTRGLRPGLPSLVNAAIEGKTPIIAMNIQTQPGEPDAEFYRRHGLVSYLGVPLLAKGEVLGVLVFLTREEYPFTEEETEFLSTLAAQAATAIHNCQLYEEMAKLAGELTKSIKVKDEFLSVMSHELRTPLNVITGYAEMVWRGMVGETNAEQDRALEKIIGCSKDLLGMISRILQATSIEAEAVKVEKKEVVVGPLLDELKSAYDVAVGKDLNLQWDYPSEFLSVKTDSEKLKHILQNLINNAIKFTDKGRVTVSVRLLPGANGVEFQVADTGIGIPEEMLPMIFEKFRQVDSSETRAYGGVGLGLYIVKKFTEMLGGNVEVESEPGKGSTFTVTIPCDSTQTTQSLSPAASSP